MNWFKKKEKPVTTHDIDYNLMYINKTLKQIQVIKYHPVIPEEDKKLMIDKLELYMQEHIKRLKIKLSD